MKEIIIDTDIGGDIDDLLSIAMAIRSPELQIMGITTVGLYSDRRAKIARGLLDLNGLQHIPVAAGASKPLSREWEFREYPNQYGDEMVHFPIEENKDAADLLIELVNDLPGKISIVAIGAMTNLAEAIKRSPDFARNVKEVLLMGGEYLSHYNECNIVSDPEAADILFRSGIPITAAGLEVCLPLAFDTDLLIQQLKQTGTTQSLYLAQLTERWKTVGVNRPIIMFDAVPLAALIDRSFIQTELKRIQIETRGQFTRGMTFSQMPHFGEMSNCEPNVHVCTDVRHAALKALFEERVLTETSCLPLGKQ